VYVSVDPGGTTGLAYMNSDYKVFVAQIEERDHNLILMETLDALEPDRVICEDFTFRQSKSKVNLDARNYIGVIELWCQTNDVPLHMQTPAQGKGFWNDDKLKKINLYSANKPHANDAVRHLLYYISFVEGDYYFLKALKK